MHTPTEELEPSPWHEGELRLQRSVGAVDRMVKPGQLQMARDWLPDQLLIRISIAGHDKPVVRTYTLSSAPNAPSIADLRGYFSLRRTRRSLRFRRNFPPSPLPRRASFVTCGH